MNLSESWGPHPSSDSRNWTCHCLYVLQTTSQKEIYSGVRTGCKEKRAGRSKFVVFFIYVLASLPSLSPLPLSMCVNGWESEHGFSKNACHHFNSHNFWSKLYFYMKFLKYVSSSIEYLWSEVQLSASSLCFFFLSHSVAVAVLSEISHVACRAPDDSFWAFLSPGVTSSPKQYNVLD